MEQQRQDAISFWKQGFNNRQIAALLNDKYQIVYWDSERVRDRIRKYKKKQDRNSIKNIIVPESNNFAKLTKNKRGLIICDVHYPHIREDFFDILNKHKNEIDFIVFGGDTLNNDSLSKFDSIGKLSFEEEIVNFYKFMVEVRNILPNNVMIYLIRGNHEYRLYKYIASMHEKQLAKFINPEVIQMLVDGFTVYENNKQIKYSPIPNLTYVPHWFINMNDELIVCHPQDFSKIECRTAMSAIDYFMKRNEQFKMVVVAHTHKFGEGKRYGRFGIQAGCTCKPQKYSDKGSLNFTPQDYTYSIVEFDNNGCLNINKCKTYHLDELYKQTEDIDYKISI